MWFESLRKKIENRTAKVGVIGLGYVGLPLSATIAKAGFQVTGIDLSEEKVNQVNDGISYISDLSLETLAPLIQRGQIRATTDYAILSELNIINICVPTPLSKSKNPDISFVLAAVESLVKHLHQGQLIILESTTYPGTTEEVVLPKLKEGGLKVGEDLFLAFSPERIDPGNEIYSIENTPKIVGGVTERCTEITKYFYSLFVNQIHPVSSPKVAETTKLLENTFRSVNIALVNEFAQMCDKMDLDVWEIIDAASTKPFGFMPFYPGLGLGGHCIPVDPHYLAWKARLHDHSPRFIDLASDINASMPEYVVGKIASTLNQQGKSIKGAKILVIGITYKADVADLRESPALETILSLQNLGVQISYHDPYIPSIDLNNKKYKSQPIDAKKVSEFDCVLVTTDHSEIDFQMILEHSKTLVDTKNATGRCHRFA